MTNLTYDTDVCATAASLGFDVVHFYDGKAHRLGTYPSSNKAYATRNMIEKEYFGSVEVIAR